jgi:hypothetical protein
VENFTEVIETVDWDERQEPKGDSGARSCWEVLRSVAICGDIAIIQFHHPKSPLPKWFAAWVKGLAATDDRGMGVR